MRIFSKCWVPVGPEWKTGDTFRIREILKDEGIPFRMPFSDVFFTSIFHMPAEDRKWNILVREKDRERAAALLVREGLCAGELLPAHSACPDAGPKKMLNTMWPEKVLTGPAKAV